MYMREGSGIMRKLQKTDGNRGDKGLFVLKVRTEILNNNPQVSKDNVGQKRKQRKRKNNGIMNEISVPT